MKYLATLFLIIGLIAIVFGLGSCYRYQNRNPEPRPPNWNSEGSWEGIAAFERFLYAMAMGTVALSIAGYFYGRTQGQHHRPMAMKAAVLPAVVTAFVIPFLVGEFFLFVTVFLAFIASYVSLSILLCLRPITAFSPPKQRLLTWLIATICATTAGLAPRLLIWFAKGTAN